MIYDEVEASMECFKDEEEVSEKEQLMRGKNSALVFSNVINYFKNLDLKDLEGDMAIYSFDINLPYNLSDEKLDEYKERYYDLVSLGSWCDNVGIFPEMYITRNIGFEKPLITITCTFTLNTFLYREGVFSEYDNEFTKEMSLKLYKGENYEK